MAWYRCSGKALNDYRNVTLDASAVSQDSSYTYLTCPVNGEVNTGTKLRTANSNMPGGSVKQSNTFNSARKTSHSIPMLLDAGCLAVSFTTFKPGDGVTGIIATSINISGAARLADITQYPSQHSNGGTNAIEDHLVIFQIPSAGSYTLSINLRAAATLIGGYALV